MKTLCLKFSQRAESREKEGASVESGSEGRQQMGVDDNTHRSQRQRPRSSHHSWEGGEEEEEEEKEKKEGKGMGGAVGAVVGKKQTGPNYRNHNESVSRGTLLPEKH